MTPDADDPHAWRTADLDRVVERAEAERERWRGVAAEVDALRVTRAAPTREVEVTVDGRGGLVDVRFGERFRTTDPQRLAASLLDCLRRAQGELADRVADVAGEGESARALVEGYRRRFPAPAEPDTRAARRPPPSTTWLR